MTGRANELLKQECNTHFTRNEDSLKKWGVRPATIFSYMLTMATKMEEAGCNQRYIQQIIQKDLANFIELLRHNTTPQSRAEFHIKEYQDRVSKGLIKEKEESLGLVRRPWSKEEDEKLKELYMRGYDTVTIAKMLKRTRGSVEGHLRHVKLTL